MFFTKKEQRNKKDILELQEDYAKISKKLEVVITQLEQLETKQNSLRGLINRKLNLGENSENKTIKNTDGLDLLRENATNN